MKSEGKKSAGLQVAMPSEKCDDKHCPFHANFPVRGRVQEGKVLKIGSHKSVSVEWTKLFYIPKYQRYEKRRSKVLAHVPPCIESNLKVGDTVKLVECRPISKMKNFVVVEKK
jgi:small subunit ribosomal protein S17